jgi:hypothetical protein
MVPQHLESPPKASQKAHVDLSAVDQRHSADQLAEQLEREAVTEKERAGRVEEVRDAVALVIAAQMLLSGPVLSRRAPAVVSVHADQQQVTPGYFQQQSSAHRSSLGCPLRAETVHRCHPLLPGLVIAEIACNVPQKQTDQPLLLAAERRAVPVPAAVLHDLEAFAEFVAHARSWVVAASAVGL